MVLKFPKYPGPVGGIDHCIKHREAGVCHCDLLAFILKESEGENKGRHTKAICAEFEIYFNLVPLKDIDRPQICYDKYPNNVALVNIGA